MWLEVLCKKAVLEKLTEIYQTWQNSQRKTCATLANTSTLNQRWSSTFINVVSTLIFGWKWKLSRRTFIDVVSTLTKQRWNNVDRIMSIQRRWTNIVSPLKFSWKWKLSRRMFTDVVSTLTNNVETGLTELHSFSFDDPMLFQRWY